MNIINYFEEKSLSGWGRALFTDSKLYRPNSIDEIQELINYSEKGSVIARGLGRSYGNPAQCKNGKVVDMNLINYIKLDEEKATVTAGGGASLDEILKIIVPKGFFIPVSAGTRYVTVGGATSSDIHGKNHHCEGSFGNHIIEIKIIDGNGKLRIFKPDSTDSRAFSGQQLEGWV